jgi:hypothetical protein
MWLAQPTGDVWTLLANIAEETRAAAAFIHGEDTLSFADLLDRSAAQPRVRRPWRAGSADPVRETRSASFTAKLALTS